MVCWNIFDIHMKHTVSTFNIKKRKQDQADKCEKKSRSLRFPETNHQIPGRANGKPYHLSPPQKKKTWMDADCGPNPTPKTPKALRKAPLQLFLRLSLNLFCLKRGLKFDVLVQERYNTPLEHTPDNPPRQL